MKIKLNGEISSLSDINPNFQFAPDYVTEVSLRVIQMGAILSRLDKDFKIKGLS